MNGKSLLNVIESHDIRESLREFHLTRYLEVDRGRCSAEKMARVQACSVFSPQSCQSLDVKSGGIRRDQMLSKAP
jgi:hypothetical protein